MCPGEPLTFQTARVFPSWSVLGADGFSPVGMVLTFTDASETGEPFLVTTISTVCSWFAFSFVCFALTSTFNCSLVEAFRLLLEALLPALLLAAVLLELLLLLLLEAAVDGGGAEVVELRAAAGGELGVLAEPLTDWR